MGDCEVVNDIVVLLPFNVILCNQFHHLTGAPLFCKRADLGKQVHGSRGQTVLMAQQHWVGRARQGLELELD